MCEYNLEIEVDCEFAKKIKTTVNFSEQVTGQIIISILSDSEIQRDLLSALNIKTNAMTLNETINYIESKESGKNSAMQLSNTQRINAIHSSYKKNSRPPKKYSNPTASSQQNNNHTAPHKQYNTKEICSYCNKFGHGNHTGLGSGQIRKIVCPAYYTHCNKCLRKGHLDIVCKATGAHYGSQHHMATIEEAPKTDHIIGGTIELEEM